MDFKDKEWQVNRIMDQLGRAAKITKCLNCGATDLNIDEDNDMITCLQCGSTWESFESYLDEMSHITNESDQK